MCVCVCVWCYVCGICDVCACVCVVYVCLSGECVCVMCVHVSTCTNYKLPYLFRYSQPRSGHQRRHVLMSTYTAWLCMVVWDMSSLKCTVWRVCVCLMCF